MPVNLDVLIVGAGISGLCAAIRLEQRGNTRYEIIERETQLGGTWWVNRYPGCGCDVASHLYSFSFAPNPDWSRSFSGGEEIWHYLKNCAERFGVVDKVRLHTAVQALRFDETQAMWQVTLDNGETRLARHVILATGALSRAQMPDIDGLNQYKGRLFHSQQWDHDYDFDNKTVAVIGTGASAIQFVPHLARRARKLTIFQRSAPWVLPKPDRKISSVERWLYRRLPWLQTLARARIYAFNEIRVIGFVYRPALLKLFEALARSHLKRSIADPVLRARVTPDYRMGCKRVLISNDYYPAIAQPNVSVIGQPVQGLNATGVISADGQHTPSDAVIFGTGFRVSTPFDRGFVTGLEQRDLAEEWESGPQAYLGTVIAGYPNLFLLTGPNTALGHNSMIYMIESQVNYIMSALELSDRTPDGRLVVGEEVQRRYNAQVQSDLADSIWNTGGCSSWYRHPSGKNTALWPDFTWRFRARTRKAKRADFTTF